MKHSICIIDDDIPAGNQPKFINDTQLLDKSILGYLLIYEEWVDFNLKSLISKLFEDDYNWYLSAFKNPSFFFNHAENNIFAPEIIIFDWDYDGKSDDSENHLKNLLKTTYSIIYVYTKADIHDAVTNLVESEKFEEVKHRIKVIKKEDTDSVDRLLEEATAKYEENFSYRFAKEMKRNAVKAIDEILVEISRLSLKDFIALFGSKEGNKYSIPTIDFVSIITEKFKHQLLKQDFSNEVETLIDKTKTENEFLARKIWSYRLYHYPVDDVVRKGDIISSLEEDNGETLFLVLSSDCHMNQFWNKNFGFVALVPIHKLSPSNSKIKERFQANKESKLKKFKLTSLSNPRSIEGITILPGIKVSSGNYFDYLLNPKEVFTTQIKLPELDNINNIKNQLSLSYKHWTEYSGSGRLRLSEPFLSPLVQFIMDNITGYGCPDFPETLQVQIKQNFNESRK